MSTDKEPPELSHHKLQTAQCQKDLTAYKYRGVRLISFTGISTISPVRSIAKGLAIVTVTDSDLLHPVHNTVAQAAAANKVFLIILSLAIYQKVILRKSIHTSPE